MRLPDQSDADAVAVTLAWLREHPEVLEMLGGPEHVSGLQQAPWPHLVVSDGNNADLRDLRWEAQYEVAFRLLGHPNGTPGQSALRRQAMTVLRIMRQLVDEQVVTSTTPVVSDVRASGMAVYQPLANGQPSFAFGVLVTIRPPDETAQ